MTWTPAMEAELRYLIAREYRNQRQRDERLVSSCNGKPGFSTAEHARGAAPKRTMNGRVTVYRCTFCHQWHVGSHLSPKSKDRRPRVLDEDEGVRL